jgi:hypothetical protein
MLGPDNPNLLQYFKGTDHEFVWGGTYDSLAPEKFPENVNAGGVGRSLPLPCPATYAVWRRARTTAPDPYDAMPGSIETGSDPKHRDRAIAWRRHSAPEANRPFCVVPVAGFSALPILRENHGTHANQLPQ